MKKSTTLFSALFFICFFCISQIAFSQDRNTNHAEKKGTTNEISSARTKSVTSVNSNNTNNTQKQIDTQGKSFQLDENDTYQGRAEEFLTLFTVKQLPSDFPKYEKWMGVRHYNEVITDYCRKHLDIVTPIVKQKLTQSH